jgi:hypothetical protein
LFKFWNLNARFREVLLGHEFKSTSTQGHKLWEYAVQKNISNEMYKAAKNESCTLTVKPKAVSVHIMEAQIYAPLILNVSNNWRLSGQLHTPADLHPQNKKVPNEYKAGRALRIVWMVLEKTKSSAHAWIQTLECPA